MKNIALIIIALFLFAYTSKRYVASKNSVQGDLDGDGKLEWVSYKQKDSDKKSVCYYEVYFSR